VCALLLHKNLLFLLPSFPSPQVIITNEAQDQTRITSYNPLVREGFLGVSPKFSNRPTACLGAPQITTTWKPKKQENKLQRPKHKVRKQAKASKPPKKSAR